MFRLIRFLPTRWWSLKAWKTWRRYLHWRMETYGAYYPAGKPDGSMRRRLLKQLPSYHRWLGEIDRLRQKKR